MKKINFKLILIALIILIILNIFIVVWNYIYYKNSSFLILDENNIWKIDGSVKKVSKSKMKLLNYSDAKLYNDKIVDGYLINDDYFKFYDKSISSNDDMYNSFIVVGDTNIKNYSSRINSELDEDDKEIITNFLDEYSIDYDEEKTITQKASINEKTIYYIVSLSTDGTDENGYSVIFIRNNNDTNLIYKTTSSDNKMRISSLNRLIDIDNDGTIEVILLSDIPGSEGNECYSLYKYDNNSYKPVISCEEE